MLGMLSGLDRKNCWTIAEHRGESSPNGLQHLLARAKWDADAVRDNLRDYVVEHFAAAGAVLVVDETGDVKRGCIRLACNASTPVPRGGSRTPRLRCS
jgi:SRSO17 transposase